MQLFEKLSGLDKRVAWKQLCIEINNRYVGYGVAAQTDSVKILGEMKRVKGGS